MLTLANFIAWLEKQNPAEEYYYCDIERCAAGQWLISLGQSPAIGCDFVSVGLTEEIVHNRPWTFGAALERARAEAQR
jgi:hypothetical protein